MKFKFALLVPAYCLTLATSTFAHDLKPGLYQVDVRVELPNMIDAATTLQKRVCITDRMIKEHDAFQVLMETPLASCPRTPLCTTGKDVGFQITCTGKSSAYANAKFKISEDEFSGMISMNMGGKNMIVIERQEGRRIGVCK